MLTDLTVLMVSIFVRLVSTTSVHASYVTRVTYHIEQYSPTCSQTIVSQDVSLFSGTIRSNLDPFSEHTDTECWEVLERCHLASALVRGDAGSRVTLDTPISQTGSLSAGERQLVALARAVLRRSNVVIMDEATSQIDTELDDQVSCRPTSHLWRMSEGV